MPKSQLKHSVVLYVARVVKNCAKLYTQEHRVAFNHGSFPRQVCWTSVRNNSHTQSSSPFLDHADCNFSSSSERLRVLTNLAWILSHGAFGLHTSCVSEDTLWTASLKVAGHIHNLLLSLVHAALLVLVYDTHLVTCFANTVLAVGGVLHVGVHDFASEELQPNL